MSEDKKDPLVKVDRDKYTNTKSASGTKSLNNGDPVAVLLDGMTVDDLYQITDKFIGEDFRKKYEKLNTGMQRMNLGNRIRGHVNKIDKENTKLVDKAKAAKEQIPTVVDGMTRLHKVADPIAKRVAEAHAKAEADKKKEAEAKAKAKAEADKAKAKTEGKAA